MSRLNLTNQSVLEPILYKKEQGSILKEPLKGSDTFFVKEKDEEHLYMNRRDVIRYIDAIRILKSQKGYDDVA
ncbi:hypothetical protein FH581_023285 (plasmid) [Leptospira weilii]|uniref:hypothetical protein n=1 Tax=Leptospira weilii TaxID=28184 RepID=UPI00201B7BBA|nr:hypothetical protein [Leptospira weilii]UPY81101.1 hypothetical protein FH581_022875 [Leptospira weilii]UPY81176.1 hypothetical protein FH581_023285 [Leptospira weilii]